MDSQALAIRCRDLAENRKGENIVVLDVHNISSITDFFVIVSGTSEPHLRAIVDEITQKLSQENALKAHARDGSFETGWVVLDYFDVIVHVMRADTRERFNLEDLWGDAPKVRPRKRKVAKKAEAQPEEGRTKD
jgi:ribosome-associated protein